MLIGQELDQAAITAQLRAAVLLDQCLDFVAEALANGASAALVSKRADGIAADAPLLKVSDTLKGLQALGVALAGGSVEH